MPILQKIKGKVKKFISPIFDKEYSEKGELVTVIAIIIAAGVSLMTGGVLLYQYTDVFGEAGSWGVKQLMGVIFFMSKLVFSIGTNIFEGVYNLDILQQPMTRGNLPIAAVVLHGWAIVRDFANMFIVLGFVVIGLATILRIREYEAQKKLLPLIITALLINFSLVITGIVIDASNITMRYFTQISGPTTIIQTYRDLISSDDVYTTITKQIDAAGDNNVKEMEIYVLGFGSVSILLGLVAMIFFIYGILLLFRYVALMCLVILSPLAFVCSVFPATRPIYEKWKSQFIQWAIIGIPTAFFVYLGTFLLISLSNNLTSDPANPLGVSIAFWVPTAFMLFAYSLIFQTSAIGASAAIGLATGAVGYAMGASRWAGGKAWAGTKGMADKASGGRLSQGGAATKDAFLGFGEKIGVVKAGTVSDRKQKRLNESTSALKRQYGDNIDDNKKLAELLQKRMTSAKDRAAITTILGERKALGYIPKDRQEAEVNNAIAFGTSKETFTKERPDLVTGVADKDARQELIKEERARLEKVHLATGLSQKGIQPFVERDLKRYAPTATAIENKKREMAKEKEQERKLGYIMPTTQDIEERAGEDYVPTTLDISDAKTKLNAKRPAGSPTATDDEGKAYVKEHIKEYYNPKLDTGGLIKAREDLIKVRSKEKAYEFKYANKESARQDLIDKEAKNLRDVKKLTGSNLDAEIKKYSDSITPANVESHLKTLNSEKEEKAISKLTVSKLRETHESQVDAKLAEHSNYGTLNRAWLEFTKELKDKYKTLMPELRDKKYVLYGATGATPADRKADYEAKKTARTLPTLSAADKAKVKDLNRKITLFKR